MFKLFGHKKTTSTLVAAVSGTLKPLEQVADPVFAQGMMGSGYGITPSSQTVVAPISGTITMVADTQHGIGIHTDNGLDILIHMGIDTVELKGAPFTVSVAPGDRVEAGQNIATMDLNMVKAAGKDTTIIVVITNTTDLGLSVTLKSGLITAGDLAASVIFPK